MKARLFPDLGVGVGLRSAHYDVFRESKPDSVSFVEVISEGYMSWEGRAPGRPLQRLEKVREHIPVVLHGVSLSIGSVDPLNHSYLKRLKQLIEAIEPSFVSDHLCWTSIFGENLHDLLPVPYTEEALDIIVKKVQDVQEYLGRRILLENASSYVEFEHSEMSEWEFISAVAERADCGILLDVNNVYVSSVNHGFDPLQYLKAIPVHRVGQIHLAGHTNKGGYLIDTHDEPICDEVWALYKWVSHHMGRISAMVERDDNIPPWEILEKEVLTIKGIRDAFEKPATTLAVAAAI